jgi:hypothetical protein
LTWAINPALVLGLDPKQFTLVERNRSSEGVDQSGETSAKKTKITLSPEARLGLIRLLEGTQGCPGFFESIAGLSRKILVSRHVIRELLAFMKRKRWLKSRGENQYEYTEKFFQLFATAKRGKEFRYMEKVIPAFLDEQKRLHAMQNVSRSLGASLPNASQYLLLILLYTADLRGVVSGIGRTVLFNMAGMSKSRTHSQLANLRKLEVIIRLVEGETLFPPIGKMASVYVLNLWHPSFGLHELKLNRITVTNKYIPPYNANPFWMRLAFARDRWCDAQRILKDKEARKKSYEREIGSLPETLASDTEKSGSPTNTSIELDIADVQGILRNKLTAKRVQFEIEEVAAYLIGKEHRAIAELNGKMLTFRNIEYSRSARFWIPFPIGIERKEVFKIAAKRVISALFSSLEKDAESLSFLVATNKSDDLFLPLTNEKSGIQNLIRLLSLEAIYLAMEFEGAVRKSFGVGGRSVLFLPLEKKETALIRTIWIVGPGVAGRSVEMERSVENGSEWRSSCQSLKEQGAPTASLSRKNKS